MQLGGKGCRSRCIPHQIGECHEDASDCLRLDRCGGDAGDTSTCRLLTRLPSRCTMPGVPGSVPAILWSAPAILWSIALLWSVPAILWSARLRLGQPNPAVDDTSILKTGHLGPLPALSPWGQRSRLSRPRSGLSRSDLVIWHEAAV